MIIQKLFRYGFDLLKFRPFEEDDALKDGFAFRFRLREMPASAERKVLFEVPGTVKISVRILDKNTDGPELSSYERSEHYFSWCGEDGRTPVLEAEIFLDCPDHPDWKAMQIGIPLSLYDAVNRDVFLVYDGMHFRFLIDGEVINENLPVGVPAGPSGRSFFLEERAFAGFGFAGDVSGITREVYEKKLDKSISYYSPAGHNTWAGDVVNFYHDGVYHLIYFIDRHHHGNRWGGGAHHFLHVTTTDFISWTDHGPLFELEEPWQSVGTGTMFFQNGRYYFSFGWHTSRVIPEDRLSSHLIGAYYKEHGETRAIPYDEILENGLYPTGGLYPNGANYAVSDDGIHFRPGRKMFHWAENPSVYSGPDNTLLMYVGGGTWQAPEIDAPWKLTDSGFPPCGDTAMRNSDECPSFFEWNGFRYLIMGVTGFWRTGLGGGAYTDGAAEGYDVYDGLAVPMAVRIGGNRVLYAGWLNGIGWGSVIVHRELIQYPDGHLGMKWMKELGPSASPDGLLHTENEPSMGDAGYACDPHRSYYFEMTVDPGSGSGLFAVRFLSSDGDREKDCELQLDFGRERAQFGTPGRSFAGPIPPAGEAVRHTGQENYCWGVQPRDLHFRSFNFSIAHVDVMKEPFRLRIVVRFSRKMDSSVIDAEIAGSRTLVSNRVGMHPSSAAFARSDPAVRVTDLRVFRYEEE